MVPVLSALLPLLLATPQRQEPTLAEPDGQWAGWLTMDDGDVPLRVRIAAAADGWSASVDLPAAGQRDMAFAVELGDGSRLLIGYPSVADGRARLALELATDDPDHLRGAVEWSGVGGVVELQRADGPLVPLAPETAEALVGLWGAAPGVCVLRRSWGELALVDAQSGEERTLFAHPDGTVFTGPGYYVPAPLERTLRLERDAAGRPTHLVLHTAAGERRLPRRALEQVPLVVERDGARLVGTLSVPEPRPRACVIVVGGSSWLRRAQVEEWVAPLTALGFACVAWDKRGGGESQGERDVPFATTAADAEAFAEAARERLGDVPVGYLGISRGGWIAPQAAAHDPRAAFLLDVVGPAVSPIEQETTARLDRMRADGASAEELALGEAFLRAMWRYVRRADGGERMLALGAEVEAAGWSGVLGGDVDLEEETWRWMRLNGSFDPRPALRAQHAPVLALYGERDLAVAARVNAPLCRDALWASDASPVRVIVLDGVGHPLRVPERDAAGAPISPHRRSGWHPALWPAVEELLRELP